MDLGNRGIVLCSEHNVLCSEHKGADLLHSYQGADLHLCFCRFSHEMGLEAHTLHLVCHSAAQMNALVAGL